MDRASIVLNFKLSEGTHSKTDSPTDLIHAQHLNSKQIAIVMTYQACR